MKQKLWAVLFILGYGGLIVLAIHDHVFTRRFWFVAAVLVAISLLKMMWQRLMPPAEDRSHADNDY